MKFSWTFYTIAVAGNLFWIMLMFLAEFFDKTLPEQNSIIPNTNQKFLYMKDFWTFSWGDPVGVSLIWAAFLHVAVYRFELRHWSVFCVLSIFFMADFAMIGLAKEHKPNTRYPCAGKLSWNGILRLPYSGITASASVFCVWLLPNPGIATLLFVSGGAFYLVCFLSDINSGNLESF
ncbi:MAG: hypothetical protein A2402_02665 [Candidatus Staskawiczbacteria bacterium RIFOXYC1_FULL_37_43]|nr:MAG: hypothetical protein A2813_03560 [Candidatus Staskawiczbacteria bacterium RIFCSPHIGHO2_01_FULL_37_17]OGZ71168.1 MAG: hypothetical protein A2891_03900 [Candidatus Staskawiczbacteria bacterium RIFCSPLOWO2_01_FULL_37_19]OGZ76263.1 MAG: hypothetical protein A2205_00615 [Candidatus Staskawiczbacteria bacterium RIFOXYA1_FULL_37_15]OGZ77635.1 MAG: hypothetical protein A2280_03570 [Candidatus Staskawiczbacteria bacterium RIFOXYA12_FULL_37_10]OGZ80278.1 MAG: hypothetical protein A2353_03325 [Can